MLVSFCYSSYNSVSGEPQQMVGAPVPFIYIHTHTLIFSVIIQLPNKGKFDITEIQFMENNFKDE